MHSPPCKSWAIRVTKLLAEFDWSQGRLALRLGCHSSTVYRWIHGRAVPVMPYRRLIEELENRKGLLQDSDGAQ